MQISKNISKTLEPFNNADETYDIKVKYDYRISKSLDSVYDEIKNLLAILTNEKGKFYYEITSHIYALNLNKNNYNIRKIKSCSLIHPTDSYEFVDMIAILSQDFHNLMDEKIFTMNINIFYDHNKVKLDSD